MKRKVFFLGAVILLLLSGCGDPVQDDLLKYVNEDLKELAVLEEDAIAEYDSVTGDNYVDDYTT
jgi:Tfp pilus assembly protein PilP